MNFTDDHLRRTIQQVREVDARDGVVAIYAEEFTAVLALVWRTGYYAGISDEMYRGAGYSDTEPSLNPYE